jgi:ribose-phosphate pyrophosphokinase
MDSLETTSAKRLQIFSGSYNRQFAEDVADTLGTTVGDAHLERFANGEVRCRLGQSARGADVFVFQSHDRPVNDAIMEQAIIIDAARRASARRITAVCPFFGYARQDRKSAGREPISAKLVVNILQAAGADRILSVDLHSGQIQGFFDGPFDHLTAMPVLLDYIKRELGTDIVIVSPDAGRVKTSERYTRQLGVDLAIVHKTRSKTKANTVQALAVIGDVKGRRCVLIDDMIDTAGTIGAAAEQLKQHGAAEVYVMATHAVFSDPAVDRLTKAPVERVVATNTLDTTDRTFPKLTVLSLAPLMAAAVKAVFMDESVSEIFGGENQM